jgi:hypothetical protein
MNTTIKITQVETFDAALAMSNKIMEDAGSFGIFAGFENNIPRSKSVTMQLKDPSIPFMVDETGRIFWVAVGPAGEKLLNKVDLHCCLDCAPFGVAMVQANYITFPEVFNIRKDMKFRRLLASTGEIYTTERV